MAKFLDKPGLERLWAKIKDYVDEHTEIWAITGLQGELDSKASHDELGAVREETDLGFEAVDAQIDSINHGISYLSGDLLNKVDHVELNQLRETVDEIPHIYATSIDLENQLSWKQEILQGSDGQLVGFNDDGIATPLNTDDTLYIKYGELGVSLPTKALSSAEYELLSEEQKMANIQYIITDDNTGGGGGTGGNIPAGGIIIWSGAADAIPDGWALCDGNNGTPDLRARFVLGAGAAHSTGERGGSKETTLEIGNLPLTSYTFTHSGTSTGSGFTSMPAAQQPDPVNHMPPYYALCYIMKL